MGNGAKFNFEKGFFYDISNGLPILIFGYSDDVKSEYSVLKKQLSRQKKARLRKKIIKNIKNLLDNN